MLFVQYLELKIRFVKCFQFRESSYLQIYRLNTKGQIAMGEWCIKSLDSGTLHLRQCDVQPTGPWRWDEVC